MNTEPLEAVEIKAETELVERSPSLFGSFIGCYNLLSKMPFKNLINYETAIVIHRFAVADHVINFISSFNQNVHPRGPSLRSSDTWQFSIGNTNTAAGTLVQYRPPKEACPQVDPAITTVRSVSINFQNDTSASLSSVGFYLNQSWE